MPISSDQIKSLIDTNLPDAGDRRNKASTVRTLLKLVVDWVRDRINASAVSWTKLGTGGSPESGADDIYRTGKVVVGRNTVDGTTAALQASSISTPLFNDLRLNAPLDIAPVVGAAAFRYFRVCQIGISNLDPNNYSSLNLLVIVGGASAAQKGTITLFGGTRNGFSGFHTIQGNVFGCGLAVYAVGQVTTVYLKLANTFAQAVVSGLASFQFVPSDLTEVIPSGGAFLYDTTVDVAKTALIDGKFGVNVAVPTESLHVVGNALIAGTSKVEVNNPLDGVVASLTNTRNSAGRTGVKLYFNASFLAAWRMGLQGDADVFVIEGWGGGTYPERLRIDSTGNIGIGTTTPTSSMHLKGVGYSLLRIENSYTPTGTSDVNGQAGQVCWDNNYIYLKTSAGWKRTALGTW